MPADIEVGAPCKPLICEIENCLTLCINDSTEYQVNQVCSGKDATEVYVYFGDTQPSPNERRKYNCGKGRDLVTEVVVEICINECSQDSCSAAIAHESIQEAIYQSECCVDQITFNKSTRIRDRKEQTDTLIVSYLVIYHDPNAI